MLAILKVAKVPLDRASPLLLSVMIIIYVHLTLVKQSMVLLRVSLHLFLAQQLMLVIQLIVMLPLVVAMKFQLFAPTIICVPMISAKMLMGPQVVYLSPFPVITLIHAIPNHVAKKMESAM
jgi:hypothetical protein